MPDQDLGRAHGKVVISSEVNMKEALAGLAAMKASLIAMEKNLGSLDKKVEETDGKLKRMSKSLSNTAKASVGVFAGVTKEVALFGKEVGSVIAKVTPLERTINDLASSSKELATSLFQVAAAASGLKSIGGISEALTGRIINLSKEIEGLPSVFRAAIGVQSSFVALMGLFKTASMGADKALARFGATSLTTKGILGGLGVALGGAYLKAKDTAGGILGLAKLFSGSEGTVGRWAKNLESAGLAAENAGKRIPNLSRGIGNLVKGLSTMGLGLAAIKKGISGFSVAMKPLLIGIASLTLLAPALKIVGVGIMGIVDSVKTLSGAIGVLPGVIATLVTSGGVLALAFAGVKDAFAAASLEGAEFDEAMAKLSPDMQELARTAKVAKNEIKNLQSIAAGTVFEGLSDDIKNLTSAYMPSLEAGVARVGKALNLIKDAGVRAFLDPQAIKDTNTIFNDTAKVLSNISVAVEPIARAFRNITVVGTEVFKELTGSIGLAALKFDNFIQKARDTGSMKNWIENGIQGFRDLWSALKDTSAAVGEILTAFSGMTFGGNALSMLAEKAEQFRAAMEKSASGGVLQTVTDHIQRLSQFNLDTLKTALGEMWEIFKQMLPVMENLSIGMSEGFSAAIPIISELAQLISKVFQIPGLAETIGQIVALTLAFKAFMFLLKPIYSGLMLIGGAFATFKGANQTVRAFTDTIIALSAMAGPTAQKYATMARVIQGAFVAVSVAAAAVMVGFMAWQTASSDLKRGNDALQKSMEHTKEGTKALVDAFMDTGGIVDQNIFKAVQAQLDTLNEDLANTASSGPGAITKAMAWLSRSGSLTKGFVEETNKLGDSAQHAKEAAAAIKQVGWSTEDASKAVVEGGSSWDLYVSKLKQVGTWGDAAVEELSAVRQRYQDVADSMARIGPENVQLANAFDQLRTAAAGSAEQLDAVKMALQSLGFLKVSDLEAFQQLEEHLDSITEKFQEPLGPAEQLGKALWDVQKGGVAASEAGAELWDRLSPLQQDLMNVAVAGGNVQDAFGRMKPTLDQARAAAGLMGQEFDQQWNDMLASMGFVPDKIEFFVSLRGQDQAVTELNSVAEKLKAFKGQTYDTEVIVKDEKARTALQQLVGNMKVINEETGEVRITGNTADFTKNWDAIHNLLTGEGPGPGGTKPLPPAQVEVKGAPPEEVKRQGDMMWQAINANVKSKPVQIGTELKYPENGQRFYNALQAASAQSKVLVHTDAPDAEETKGKLAGIKTTSEAVSATPAEAEASAPGADEAAAQIDGVSEAFANAVLKMGEFANGIASMGQIALQNMNTIVQNIIKMISLPASMAEASGMSIGVNLAAGMDKSRKAVEDSALALMEAASKPMPRSPAEIGPFSGKGWTLYRGRALASGFAKGVYDGQTEAQDATLDMMDGISKTIDASLNELKLPATSFDANIANTAGTRYYRDPEVSNAELEKARTDKAEQEAADAKDQAYRDKKSKDLEIRNLNNRIDFDRAQATTGKQAIDAQLKADQSNTDYIGAMTKVAEQFGLQMTSGVREGDPGHHGSGRAADFSNGQGNTDQMLAFADFVEKNFKPYTKELIYDDPRFAGREVKEGENVGRSFYAEAGDHTNHVHWAVDVAPVLAPAIADASAEANKKNTEAQTEALSSGLDQEQQGVANAIIAEGRRQNRSDKEIQAALAAGLVESDMRNLDYGAEDSVGPLQLRAMHGTVEERMDPTFAANWFYKNIDALGASGTPGEIAADVERPREDLRYKYSEREAEAAAILAASGGAASAGASPISQAQFTEEQEKSTDELIAEMRKGNEQLDKDMNVLANPSSTDREVIQALQSIDDQKLTVEDPDVRDGLTSLEESVMTDRGLKKYDPFENASEDVPMDVFKGLQSVWGLVGTIESGLSGATETAKLLIRGISNTEELGSAIDGFQSMADTVGQIVSTVGSVVDIVASVAAAAGSAIPGVGAVTGVVSAITGGIGNVNAIIDLVQDVAKFGGRMVGGVMSLLAGGSNGALQGNVRTLMDANDRTIKTWSNRNPNEKSSFGFPGGTPSNPNQAKTQGDINIYQGPGSDPAEMMNNAMFAVKAHSQGVFSG